MRTRILVSTDVAAIGVWDRASGATGNATPLETLARQGEACVVRLGADCGGAVDVFVDEDLPAAVLAETTSIGDEQAIVVRSGEVVIDGIEYFGAGSGPARPDSTCRVPNGRRLVNVRVTRDEDTLPEPASEGELRRIAGAAEVEYYDRTNRRGVLIGLSTWLLLPALLFFTSWYAALGITLVVFVGYFHVRERLLRRNPRYQRAAGKIVPLRLAGERPILVVHLTVPPRG